MDDTTGRKPRPPLRKLVIATLLPVVIGGLAWYFLFAPMRERDHLRQTGIKVHGRLLDVETTNTMVNHSPELELTVEFRRRDGVLDTGKTLFVPRRRSLSQFNPGMPVLVAYDSADPGKMTIDGILEPTADDHTGNPAPSTIDSLKRMADSLKRMADSMTARARQH